MDAHDIAVAGDRLLVAVWDETPAIEVFSLTDPDRPTRVSQLDLDSVVVRLSVSNDRALLLQGTSAGPAVALVDLSDPDRPRLGSSLAASVSMQRVVSVRDALYVWYDGEGWARWGVLEQAGPDSALQVRPLLPEGHFGTADLAPILDRQHDRLRIVARTGADYRSWLIDELDVNDPRRPVLRHSLPLVGADEVAAMAIDGSAAVVWRRQSATLARLELVDLEDLRPSLTPPSFRHRIRQGQVAALALRGGFIYAASETGLVVVDTADRQRPRQAANVVLGGAVTGMVWTGSLLHVLVDTAGTGHGRGHLATLDLSDLGMPRLIGRVTAGPNEEVGSSGALAVEDVLAVVGAPPYGIDLIDLSDPAHGRRLRTWPAESEQYLNDVSDWSVDVALADGRIFAVSPLGGLVAYDRPGLVER
jgi:hypothetical protein